MKQEEEKDLKEPARYVDKGDVLYVEYDDDQISEDYAKHSVKRQKREAEKQAEAVAKQQQKAQHDTSEDDDSDDTDSEEGNNDTH